jgi:DNA-binding transcriptional LysR family regulator
VSLIQSPFDTHLLRVFCTLLTERSVSRTAIKLNKSQPAISVALKHLRDLFNDPLLVRDKGGMVPTERALELLDAARGALGEIDRMFVVPEVFDAATTRRTFSIGSPDYLVVSFLTGVVEAFRRAAPSAHLVLGALGPDFNYERALAEGELDIVIGNWPEPPEQLHLSALLEDRIVCVMGRDNPLAKRPLTVQQYLQAPHVVPLPYSPSRRGVVDTHLASLRVTRNTRVVVPFFTMAPHLLPGTDLIFTTTRHFAEHYAQVLPLAIVDSPIEFPPVRFYQLWHERTHHSDGHRWLRGLLTAAGERLWQRPGPARLRKGIPSPMTRG